MRLGTATGRDNPRVHPDRVEAAEKSGVLNFHTAVHYDFQARSPRAFGGRFVDDAELHPDHFGAPGDRLLDDGWDGSRLTEDVHHLEASRNSGERRITFAA